jgi:hypothetical protein
VTRHPATGTSVAFIGFVGAAPFSPHETPGAEMSGRALIPEVRRHPDARRLVGAA